MPLAPLVVMMLIVGCSDSISPQSDRFTAISCGSIVDDDTKSEWVSGPRLPPEDVYTWLYDLEVCGSGWNEPTARQVAELHFSIRDGGLPESFAESWAGDSVWIDTSEVIMRGNMYLGSNPGAYDLDAGRVVILRGNEVRPLRTLATRPYFTEEDRQASPPEFSD